MSDISTTAYAQWVVMDIQNYSGNRSILIQNVKLDWGKFHQPGDKDREVPRSVIDGHVIKPQDNFVIYSCGREDSPSGTTGSFDIVEDSTKIVIRRIYWDCPWGRKENTFEVNGTTNKKWSVEHSGENLDSGSLGTISIEFTPRTRA